MKRYKMNNKYILTLTLMLAAMLSSGTVTAQVTVRGSVYGGGNKADVSGAVTVSMSGGTVTLDVYGGGALANTNTENWQSDALVTADYQAVSLAEGASLVGYYSKSGDTYTLLTSGTAPTGGTYYKKTETIVILTGGTVNGDVYGGGLGDDTHEAMVYGEVTVNIGATTGGDSPTYSGDATIGGSVFGCNNVNGTPKSDVVVNIYKTHHEDSNQYPANVTTLEGLNSLPNTDDQYAIKAVYGGGNLASYTPVAGSTPPHSATVHVYACDDNTVRTVYGGGNAADVGTTGDGAITANTNVIIEGGRFDRIFGGGNGYSETNNHSDPTAANYNPGANIYGTATTEIRGGLYNQVFGGSNQYGNITTASLIIKQVCDYLLIKESFGGANEAELNGDVTTTLACGGEGIQIGYFYGGSNMADINGDVTLNVEGGTYLSVFGGSKGTTPPANATQAQIAAASADINGNVTLNLYGGTMDNAFGGSDVNGNISGKITVNMLDRGGSCGLVVHNIYGGGRDAAYTPTTSGAYPEVNLINGTVSKKAVTEGENTTYTGGNVFGGGLGSTAIVSSSPQVTVGYDASMASLVTSLLPTGVTLTTASVTVEGDVYGGGEEAAVTGSIAVTVQEGSDENMTITTTVNGDVYGGGALANTNTDQTTNLGTEDAPAHHSTTVTMGGGTVNNVYGGGLGDATHEALVNGAVAVTVNGGTVSNVFGCNNINGAPQGTVVVTVEQTASTMAVTNVFGGGNLAQYSGNPEVNIINGTVSGNVYGGGKGELASGDSRGQKGKVTGNPQVTIGDDVDGHAAHVTGDVYGGGDAANVAGTPVVVVNDCATTIGYLYGGGNAADVTGTNITVNGGSITQAYGGGHGDKNVTEQPLKYADVNGNVVFNVYGGTIAQVFAGSNSKGSITGTSALTVNKTGTCDMKIGEVYGGGNEAAGNAGTVTIGCTGTWTTDDDNTDSNNSFHDKHNSTDNRIGYELEGIGTVYGGANQADIGAAGDGNASDITLNINSGIVENVFGGNNTSGTIHGTITVNILKDNAANCAENWYVGNVYGGGNLAPYTGNPAVNILNGTVSQNVYGGGKGNTAVVTGSPVVHVGDANEAYCAIVSGDVYGGGDAAAVTGNTSVVYDDSHASSTVTNLFGGGNAAGVSGTSAVTLTNGVVTAGTYGGCNTSGSVGDVEMSLNGGTVGVSGTTTDVVYGGGYGHGTSTTGDIGITLNGTTVYGNLYGGSALGAVGASSKTTSITISSNTLHGNVFGGGMGSGSGDETKATTNGDIEINYNTANTNLTGLYGGANVNGTVAGNITVNVKANAGASGDGNSRDIFGGGYGENTSTSGNVTVNVGDNTNTTAPVVYGDVYGGSALGQVNASTSTTTVNILSGTLHGNTYGGGLGEANVAEGGNITTDNSAKGQVNGNVVVNIGATDGAATPAYTGFATIDGSVYGCNNTNGSPKGSVTVNIYKTGHTDSNAASYIENDGTHGEPTYAINDVFGGGNLADYTPTDNSSRATVHVYTCENTIRRVFGGGNAAAALGVVTVIDGGRFGYVFGGGNGEVTAANIGAGGTNLTVHGGNIAQLFGGSNHSGTISGTMGINVDATGDCARDMYIAEFFCGSNEADISSDIEATIGCGTHFGDVYGGCNLADITGSVTLTIEGGEMDNVYGGSKGSGSDAADISGSVTLNIYGGKINQNAYGGSNINGNINGSITVNMDWSQASSDCNSESDLYVGNIYGASNDASYTPTEPGSYPEVNIKNGTVSGSVFGGGKGATATVTSNPVVNVGDPADGHESYVATVVGDVYGGGDAAAVTGNTTVNYQKANNTAANLFGGGNAAGVSGTATVNLSAGTVSAGVYGGCNTTGTVGGAIAVNVTGGTVGTDATHTADIYGGGYGSSTATGGNVTVTIGDGSSSPVVWGDVYGGSALGNVNDDAADITKVWLKSGTVNGCLYGGGLGRSAVPDNPSTTDEDESVAAIEALVNGIVQVVVDGGSVVTTSNTGRTTGSVFGCNNLAGSPQETVAVTIGGGTISGNVYGGGNLAAYTGNPVVTMTAGTAYDVYGGGLGSTAIVTGNTNVTISGGTVSHNVYGGGSEANVTGSVDVTVSGGQVVNDVYGGGALADTNTSNWTNGRLNNSYTQVTNLTAGSPVTGLYTYDSTTRTYTEITDNEATAVDGTTYYENNYKTTVNLIGGIVGNAYGGGLGRAPSAGHGQVGDDNYVAPVAGIEAIVYGDVTVNVNGTAFVITGENREYKDDGTNKNETVWVPITGCVFGANNLNGTPKGNIRVNIYSTTRLENGSPVPNKHEYDEYEIYAVYGGGNLANYLPESGNTKVLVQGCGQTSVYFVYGGGNSASVPQTHVTIDGTFEVGVVFGGGNGNDPIQDDSGNWVSNTGADVKVGNTPGTGTIIATRGIIRWIYGGSNKRGVCGEITQTLESANDPDCPLKITNVYGAGRNADVENVDIVIKCPGQNVDVVYGGSFNARIAGNVKMTLIGGVFNKVFGGNDNGGSIGGNIEVNIQETSDCQPVIINNLYGGGNQAAYPGIPGKTDGSITVNVKSCTRIGNIYGGGLGERAIVSGNTEVNVNMVKGYWAGRNVTLTNENLDFSVIPNITVNSTDEASNTVSCTIDDEIGTIGHIFGGGDQANINGNATVNIGTEPTVTIWNYVYDEHNNITQSTSSEAAVLGAHITGNVYGGGDHAAVTGNTQVNICAKENATTQVYEIVNPGTNGFASGVTIGGTEYHGVFGGGNLGLVEGNSYVYQGGGRVNESVYGGGCEADVKGNTFVTMLDGYVKDGVYGGGLQGSVGTINSRVATDHDTTHADCVGGKPDVFAENTGKCTVVVSGGQVGPVEAALQGKGMNADEIVDVGFVFGAGRGDVENPDVDPDADFRAYVQETDVTISGGLIMASVYGGGENGRVRGNTLVKIEGGQIGCGEGSVTGSGTDASPYVAHAYQEGQFIDPTATTITSGTGGNALAECSHWPYGRNLGDAQNPNWVYETYDPYADDAPTLYPGGSTAHPSDGKTYYGCVFGGGSGYYPYEIKSGETLTGYEWLRSAGIVEGNTEVRISGGHILTNVYGGNEYTDVLGSCTVKMSGGTLGVPRTLEQIKSHPQTCYLFGAGKGDPRSHFNTWTNVSSVNVEVSGGIIYGSVFGGAEDGHVQGNVTVEIKEGTEFTIGGNTYTKPIIGTWGTSYVDGNVFGGGRGFSGENLLAGNVGGNVEVNIEGGMLLGSVYGGGRLGSVGLDTSNGEMQDGDDHGHITVNIINGTIGNTNEYKYIAPTVTGDALTTAKANMPNTELESNNQLKHTKGGNVYAGGMGRRTKLDNVTEITGWENLGNAKSTTLNISGDNTWIMGNVYGGGELGAVTGSHSAKDAENNDINVGTEINVTGGTIGTEITENAPVKATIEVTTTGNSNVKYTFGSVYGGGMGSEEHDAKDNHGGSVKSNTKVSISGAKTEVRASVFGGGEMAATDGNTYVVVDDGKIGRNEVQPLTSSNPGYVMFGGATMGNVYGGGKGHVDHTLAGVVKGNTHVNIIDGNIYHNVYGGGALASVGTFDVAGSQNSYVPEGVPYGWTENTGTATVTITGGTIGISGRDNGMVNGSSRGNIAKPVATTFNGKTVDKDPYDKVAWINKSIVTIGTSGASSGPTVKGSVYGGGENGHNASDAQVTVYSGKIGIFAKEDWDDFRNAEINAKALITRGNVYGAGCGTDTYWDDADNDGVVDAGEEHHNLWSGIVAGNTVVTVSGGHVSNNVYGGGSMGSVGTITSDLDDTQKQHKTASGDGKETYYSFGLSWPLEIDYLNRTGLASVTIDGTAQIDGSVFGSTRGIVELGESDIEKHRYVEAKFSNARETKVVIGTAEGTGKTNPQIGHSVYGGGEDGHVYENASVTIYHGKIGRSVYGGGRGEGTFSTTLWKASGSSHENVESPKTHSWTAGRVYGNTTVTMYDGSVGWFIYGGGDLGSVGKGNYAGGQDDYATGGYGELPSDGGNLWTATTGFKPDEDIDETNHPTTMADYFLSSGKSTVNLFGGEVGSSSGALINNENKSYDDDGVPYGSVFGGSRGKAAATCKESPRYRYVPDFFLGYVNRAIINIGGTSESSTVSGTGPTIYGSVYGGGQDGHVRNSTEVKIYKGNISGQDASVDEAGRSGHVFGAGSGIGTYDTGVIKDGKHVMACNNASGSVTCTTLVEVYGENSDNASTATTKINGNVYGGGAMASVGPPRTIQTYDEYEAAEDNHQSHTCTQVNIKGGRIGGSVFAASRGPSDAFRQQSFEGKGIDYDPLSFATVLWPNVHVSGGVIGAGEDGGSVFGGGETGYVKCGVDVNILGGTIKTDVYGGGARAHTNTSNLEQDRTTSVWSWTDATNKTAKYTTTVNLLGGTIEGDAYGGGLGRREYGEKGQTGYKSAASALVFGNVKVNLNGLEQEDYHAFNTNTHASTTGFSTRLEQISTNDYQIKDNVKGAVVKRIFGCNNLLGSPQGKVRVHVFGTQNSAATQIANTPAVAASGDTPAVTEVTDAKVDGRYDMEAVYGGANLAAYMPMGPNALSETATDIDNLTTDYKNTTQSTEVIIDGCHRTSIEEVYGGGNAAPVPATNLVVNGTYEIFEAFGGGNGLDKYYLKEGTSIVWYQNPGANVGYRDYTEKGTGSGEIEDDPILAKDKSDAATKEMRQATYGYGSGVATTDIKGGRIHNVYGGSNKRGNIRTTALSLYEGVNDDCPMDVDESYGAGKDAPIDGEVDMRMRCAHGVKEIFGGSKNSDVNSDINLTITNGSSLERVFGGNNTSGAIAGSITVNIEEGGCEPIIIKELYAGGYLAPYSIYGYESDGRGGYLKKPEDYGGDIGTINQAQPLTKKRYEEDIKPTYEGYMTADLTALGLTASATNEVLEAKIAELRVIANDTQKTEEVRDAASALIDKALEVIAIRQLLASYPKKDPRINVISATRIDNIFGGGYRALVVGSPHVNVNMTNGRVEVDNVETSGTYVDAEGTTYSSVYPETKYHVTVNGTKVEVKKMEMTTEIESQLPTVDTNDYKETGGDKTYVYINGNTFYKVSNVTSSTKYYATLDIGTIGNIYGGGNLADIDGNTYVEIGTGKWLTWDASGNPVWEATDADGNTYTSSQTGNAVNYTQTECNAYNATLSGYIPSGVKLTSDQASAVNTALGLTGDNAYNADDEIYTEDAALYNATLSGYWSTSTVKTQAVYYTQAEIDAAQEGDDAYGKKPTDIKTPTVYYTQAECNEHNYSSDPVNVVGIIACTTALTAKKAVAVNEAISTSYASGDKIYTEDAVAYNATLNGYLTTADVKTAAVWTWSDASNVTATQPTSVRKAATITGNVFGGGKGKADTFTCEKAMVGVDGEGVANPEGGTNVTIANGTVGTIEGGKLKAGTGNVYGGGQIGRVEKNTMVTIGVEANDAPVIYGDVFGAGQGVETHGYSALVRGNPTVIIQGKAQVKGSVYGGGEIASVARYKVVDGSPVALANKTSGNCKVIIRDNAEIGPDGMKMYHEDEEPNPLPPHDTGHVFGAGKGVMPKVYDYVAQSDYTGETYKIEEHLPRRMLAASSISDKIIWEYTDASQKNIWQYFPTESAYLEYIETLALSSKTDVTIGGNAFVKGSVYGGSLNGIVQYNTHVAIQDHCQIGQGDEILTRYEDYTLYDIFGSNTPPVKSGSVDEGNAVYYDLECAHWEYDNTSGATYDPYAIYLNQADGKYYYDAGFTTSARDGSYIAKDGHTYYGNVFGGGSGVIPYAPGKWHRAAGVVRGNTVVDITGGHILTSVYGGNEQTDVGIYDKDFYNNNEPTIPKSGGLCTVNFGGTATLGVPRTLNQIAAHPVTCYLFGAGKGDMRTFFNTWTNIREAEVNVTGGKIYGSVFGGGEDGHVLEDVTVNISNSAMIGTTGTSSVDGNVFGAGRGFAGDAITAGSVGGNVEVNISGGTMLGSVYGGGRLASVGIGFHAISNSNYGQFTEDDITPATYYEEGDVIPEGKTVGDEKTPAVVNNSYGHVTVNISGGTIGNDLEDITVEHTKGGNVYGGSMGRLTKLDGSYNTELWPQLGQVKTTAVNISGNSTVIKNNVYGGGELGPVRDNAAIIVGKESKTSETITSPTICRNIFGGGYGSGIFSDDSKATVTAEQDGNTVVFGYSPMQWAGIVGQRTEVSIYGGWVKKSVYGGGEMASVGIINYLLDETEYDSEAAVPAGKKIFRKNPTTNKYTVYSDIVKHADESNSFALSWPYKLEYLSGYEGTTNVNIFGGRIGFTGKDFMGPYDEQGRPLDVDNNNAVLDPGNEADAKKIKDARMDNGDIYGGGKGLVGDRYDYAFCANVNDAHVNISYPSDNGATPENYKTKEGDTYTYDCVSGAVYGGGENGHVIGNTEVTLTNGLIGHALYGGGSGKGQYTQRLLKIGKAEGSTSLDDYHDVNIYSITAGKVFGNTKINMEGGYVVRNIYGGGNMGSVGKGNYAGGSDDYYPAGYGETLNNAETADGKMLWDADKNDNSSAFLNSGKTEVIVTGGQVGYVDNAKPKDSMKDGLPYGNIFGGCRGESAPNILESPRYQYSPEFFSGYVNETSVKIGKTLADFTGDDAETAYAAYAGPVIYGSVYGGGQDGHVRRDTHVTVNKGEIGLPFTDANRTVLGKTESTTLNDELDNPLWLYRGNVYGGGSGIGKYYYDFNANDRYTKEAGQDEEAEENIEEWNYVNPLNPTEGPTPMKEIDYSTSAGSVTRFTKVEVNGGTIHRNVYGGGSLSSVGPPAIPTDREETAYKEGVTKRGDGTDAGPGWWSQCEVIIKSIIGSPTYDPVYGGEVYGASRGDIGLGESFGNVVWTLVKILNGANIKGNVFGGGDNGIVKQDTDVQIGEAQE